MSLEGLKKGVFDMITWSYQCEELLPLTAAEVNETATTAQFNSQQPTPNQSAINPIQAAALRYMELEFNGPTVAFPLKQTFGKVVADYPNGVSILNFISKFYEVHGYRPDFHGLGFSSFEAMCRSIPDIFFVLRSPLDETLLFPASSKDRFGTAMDLFNTTWGQIKALMGFNQFVLKVDDIPGKFQRIFCMKLDPKDWTSSNDNAFIEYCLEKWPSVVPIYLEDDITGDPSRSKVLVQRNSNFLPTLEYERRRQERKTEEEQKLIAEKALQRLPTGITLKDFARYGDNIEYLTNDIIPGKYYKCLAGMIETPGNFYVNIISHWNDLESLMARMQTVYNGGLGICRPDTIWVGLYVAARRKIDGEWHRAMIIDRVDKETFEVINVDYGDMEIVDVRCIRYLTIELLGSMKAQAIRCSANLGRVVATPSKRKDDFDEWTTEEGDILRDFVNDRDLVVKFVSKTNTDETPAWLVFVHILDTNTKMSIAVDGFHVERKVVAISRDYYTPDSDEETEKCKFVPLISKDGQEIHPDRSLV